MKAILGLLLFLPLSTLAQNFPGLKQTNLTATDGLYYEGPNGSKFVISTEKFTSRERALAFCASHMMSLSQTDDLMALAMMSEQHPQIADSLSFKIPPPANVGGTILWVSKPRQVEHEGQMHNGEIAIFQDGAGDRIEYGSYDMLKPLLEMAGQTGVSALCGRLPGLETLALGDASVDNSYRNNIPDKSSSQSSPSGAGSGASRQ